MNAICSYTPSVNCNFLPCNQLSIGKIVLVALSILLIGLGIATYFYGPQILPQVFSTTKSQIIGLSVIGGCGILLGIGVALYSLRTLMKKPDFPKKKTKPLPPTCIVTERIPIGRRIRFLGWSFGSKEEFFFITFGDQALAKLKTTGNCEEPAVIVHRTAQGVNLRAINGGLLTPKEEGSRMYKFKSFSDEKKNVTLTPVTLKGFKLPYPTLDLPPDSEANPIVIVFDEKPIHTYSPNERSSYIEFEGF